MRFAEWKISVGLVVGIVATATVLYVLRGMEERTTAEIKAISRRIDHVEAKVNVLADLRGESMSALRPEETRE